MDQLKEILQQAAKYRFWIAVGIAALLPLIAYFVGTGAIAEEEKAKTGRDQDAADRASSRTPRASVEESAVDRHGQGEDRRAGARTSTPRGRSSTSGRPRC